jgi:hypothetical protein
MTLTPASHIEWSVVADAFQPDGALRDIYVQGATLAEWQAALELLRANYAPLQFTIDRQPAELPAEVSQIFPIWERASPLMNFDVGGIDVACHFFTPDEIEFDLQPEDVTGPERLAAVASFLRDLALAVQKPAILTMESMPEAIVLGADPMTGLVSAHPTL